MPTHSGANSAEITDIQRRMAQIRRDMYQDVQGAVRGAQSLTDWRSIIANHPWGALGIAIGVGYLVVPHRAEPLATQKNLAAALEEAKAAATPPTSSRTGGFRPIGLAFSLLAPVLVRAAQTYAFNHLEQWLAGHPLITKDTDRGFRTEPGRAGPGDVAAPTVRFPERR
jgi:hypothetical protein